MSEIKFKDNMFYIENEESQIVAKITFYYEKENVIAIDHTLVNKELRGQNIAGELLKKVVSFVRENNLLVIPICSYAVVKLTRNDEYKDILYKG